MIITKTYNEPPFCEKEILRYASCRDEDENVLSLIYSCIDEVRKKLSYKVCYGEFDVDYFKIKSEIFTKNLKNCSRVIVFAATIGVEIDRLIAKYGRISPSRALIFQAIGAERIEALCDTFCKELANEKKMNLSPRFSPGYGDLPLSVQKYIFDVLDCSKHIGLTLNDSLLMSPSKSVTAFVGLSNNKNIEINNKCTLCDKTDCAYRGAI